MRPAVTLAVFVAFAMTAGHVALGQDDPHVDAPRVTGTLSFTCTPDPRSKAAGAAPFDDTLDIFADRVESKALKAEGFPIALAIPKVAGGVTEFKATFKRNENGATATYFVRAKADGSVSGSLTRNDPGGKTRRYTLGTRARAPAATTNPAADAAAALDPGVLRVNGAFVRLMSIRSAMADAGVNADRAKLAAILKSAGEDHNALRVALLTGEVPPAEYVKRGEARLAEARGALKQLFGDDRSGAVEAAYAAPFAKGYVTLNQMRAAVADAGAPADATKRADQVVVRSLVELAALAKKREQLTPDALWALTERARGDVVAALGERGDARRRFERLFEGLASSGAEAPTGKP